MVQTRASLGRQSVKAIQTRCRTRSNVGSAELEHDGCTGDVNCRADAVASADGDASTLAEDVARIVDFGDVAPPMHESPTRLTGNAMRDLEEACNAAVEDHCREDDETERVQSTALDDLVNI